MTSLLGPLQYAILPILAFPLIGYVMGARGAFTADAARGANVYVAAFALPAMLFFMLARVDLSSVEYQVIAIYLGSEVALYALTFVLMWRAFGRTRRESALIAMAASFPNHVFLAAPIADALYGPGGADVIATMVAFDVVLIMGSTIVMLEAFRGEQGVARTMMDIAGNRMLIAIAAGIGWNLSGLSFHDGVARFLALAGGSATPTALFALGVIVSTADLRRIGMAVWTATGVKIVLHPVIAVAAIGAFGPVSDIWRDASLLAFAAPCSAMAFVLGLRYNVDIDIIIKAILLSTALSVISFAVLAST